MVFNYVPRGYHGSSISSVWQCNSLCPAAMSAKLRQFTCSCSYIALGKNDLPSILCIHLISSSHTLTPPTCAVTGVTKSKGELCLIFLSIQRRATKTHRSWLIDSSALLHFNIQRHSSWVKRTSFQCWAAQWWLNGMGVHGCIKFQTLFNPGMQKKNLL